ncbi:cytochrome P450 [Allocatelliglobosispora scoriae]|uniref:Cytochrome P450 n=1 Tax=Allocatelliglobosispora scoriae TaxID=643052 RepID=A0A841BJ79_9ACTN|nr:cytochrome P450 [Allocatelliglobosispora scoriae]MBB5867256.1 cytochrome P450 [Allocatelliglobosispora scoriae]
MDPLQHFIRTDQAPGARILVAPSGEAEVLCRWLGRLVAPRGSAATWPSRLLGVLVVAPFAQFTLFSFDLQAFLYEVFHERLPAKVAHLALMPAVNFFVMAGLAQVWFGAHPSGHRTVLFGANLAGAYAVVLITWYMALAVRTGLLAWGLVMVPIVGGLWMAANAYYGWFFELDPQARSFFRPTSAAVDPWLGALLCAALIALSHGSERKLPPRVTGSQAWLPLPEFLGGGLPLRRRAARVMLVAVQPVSGMFNELVASPRLMPYGILMRMFALGYRPQMSRIPAGAGRTRPGQRQPGARLRGYRRRHPPGRGRVRRIPRGEPVTDLLPGGPSGALLQTLRFARDPYGLFLGGKARYGDPFTVPTLFGRWFVTGRPEGIKAILGADPLSFGPSAAVPMEWYLGPGSIALLAGERHLRERRLIMPAFHGSRMRAHGAAIQGNAVRRLAALRPGERITMVPFAKELSRRNVISTVFGVQDDSRAALFDEAIREVVGAVTPLVAFVPLLRRDLFGLTPWRRIQRWLTVFDTLVHEEIQARRAVGSPGDDVISAVLEARDEDGAGMSDRDVRDELVTFLSAGQEASSHLLAWAVYWILREPGVHDRLLAELEPLGRTPDPDALARLPFLSAVIDETLRIHPIGPSVERHLLEPMDLLGHRLPAGTVAVAATVLAHADPQTFPEPHRFLPQRFLDRRFTASEYLPFGGGARRCPGAGFAVHEVKITLGTLLAAHRFDLADSRPVAPKRYTVTVGPAGGVGVVYRGPR